MLVKHFQAVIVNSSHIVKSWKLQAASVRFVPVHSALVVLRVWFSLACVDDFAFLANARFAFVKVQGG